jgi:glycosyltransferase involved in cell wall biosynthesis
MSRILLVTISLVGRSGTEVVCSETAYGLRKRKHEVSIYVHFDGPMADSLRADGFQVVTNLELLDFVPEVIQANQTFPLLDAVGRFPDVPVISICHDSFIWWNEPVDLPSIRRYCAVDLACRARIVHRFAHLAERVELLHNAVDLDRFKSRPSLPDRPKRALILAKGPTYLAAIRAACQPHGISVDAVGPGVGHEIDNLSSRLFEYDLVFATARAALEAMAVGCAVILIDSRGLGGLVTREVVSSWRDNNFGRWLLTRSTSPGSIAAEIERYDPNDAQMVSDFIRKHSSLEFYLDRLEELYRAIIADGASLAVDKDMLLYRMSQSFRSLALARKKNALQNALRTLAHRLERLTRLPIVKLGRALRNTIRRSRI